VASESPLPYSDSGHSFPRPGETIGGKYELIRTVGVGGMGIVFEAKHLRLQHRVAVKVLHPAAMEMDDFVYRFEREARAAAQLNSINIGRVIDVDTLPGGLPYIVLEFLDGRDLDEELHDIGPLPIEAAVDYVMQACAAMAEAHAVGTVHRDLKPANLFLCTLGPSTTRKLVKVIDFGISKLRDPLAGADGRSTSTQAVFGTAFYMSPEQIRSTKAADGRSDVWALGVILFELITGRTPFIGSATSTIASIAADPIPKPSEFRQDIPPALEAAIMRTLEKDPNARFQTVQAFAAAISTFGPHEPISHVLASLSQSNRDSAAMPIARVAPSAPPSAIAPAPAAAPTPEPPIATNVDAAHDRKRTMPFGPMSQPPASPPMDDVGITSPIPPHPLPILSIPGPPPSIAPLHVSGAGRPKSVRAPMLNARSISILVGIPVVAAIAGGWVAIHYPRIEGAAPQEATMPTATSSSTSTAPIASVPAPIDSANAIASASVAIPKPSSFASSSASISQITDVAIPIPQRANTATASSSSTIARPAITVAPIPPAIRVARPAATVSDLRKNPAHI
jgi:serine/threonine protein kinase